MPPDSQTNAKSFKRYKDLADKKQPNTAHDTYNGGSPKKGSYMFLKQQMTQLKRDISTESLNKSASKYALQEKLLMSEDAHKIIP